MIITTDFQNFVSKKKKYLISVTVSYQKQSCLITDHHFVFSLASGMAQEIAIFVFVGTSNLVQTEIFLMGGLPLNFVRTGSQGDKP